MLNIISKSCAQKILSKLVEVKNDKIHRVNLLNVNSLYLADVLIYSGYKTYTSSYPIGYNRIELGSTIHTEHYENHMNGFSAAIGIRNQITFNKWINS